jgi:hypothetical protein
MKEENGKRKWRNKKAYPSTKMATDSNSGSSSGNGRREMINKECSFMRRDAVLSSVD